MPPLEKLPPQNIEAEQAILGSCMIDSSALLKVAEVLPSAGDFYRESHQIIYNAVMELAENNQAVDILTVSNLLKEQEKFEQVGGSSYLTDLLNVMPTTANVVHYAEIVRSKAVLRSLIQAGAGITELGFDEMETSETLLDKAEAMIFNISKGRITGDFSVLKTVLEDVYEKTAHLYQNKAHITGVETHYSRLDHLTAGLQPSDLVILAARPAMGKTAFALNIALNAATRKNNPSSVAIFSLEMSKEQLASRLICSHAGIDSNRLRTGFLGQADWPKLTRAMNDLTEAPLYIDDSADISVFEMRSKARRLQKNYGLDFLVVDYIQLIRGSSRTDNRALELSQISRQLKILAKELNIPIMCLSQLSRKVEDRTDKRPLLSDLRESGAIEQDADMVMFIYRDSYYKRKDEDTQPDNTSEIIIAKQRNGPLGVAKLGFIEQYTRFVNLEEGYSEN